LADNVFGNCASANWVLFAKSQQGIQVEKLN